MVQPTTEQHAVETATTELDSAGAPAQGDTAIAAELLVEEISIDGMCGVY
jgi:mycofactocin precursor